MERESDLHQEKDVWQKEFTPLPTFPETDDKPAISEQERKVLKEKLGPAIKTSLSDIEKVFPWLLKKEGYIKGELIKVEKNQRREELSVIGQRLHEAESLFGIVLQRASRKSMREFLPSARDETLLAYWEATGDRYLSGFMEEVEIAEVLKKIWNSYCDQLEEREEGNKGQNRVLPGFGVTDPVERMAFSYGDEVRALGESLAESWAGEIVSDQPLTWEFREDAYTQREVMMGVKIGGEINLYFTAALDSVSRLTNSRGKVKAQVIDFKTGQKRERSKLEKIIDRRQKEIMKLLAESFIAQYLVGYESSDREKKYFQLYTKQDVKKEIDRTTMVAYRRFNKKSGEMGLEEFEIKDENRENLNEWLIWYGGMMRKHEADVRRLMGADFWYDFSSVELVK